MNYLSVYNNLKDTSCTIKLLFDLNGRQYNLARPSTDLVGKTLKRIGISVLKAATKSSKKQDATTTKNKANHAKGKTDEAQVSVQLFFPNGDAISEEVTNSAAWRDGNILQIDNDKFLIEENTPIVVSACLPSVIMAGFPIVPTLQMDFSDKMSSQYKWFRQNSIAASDGSDCSDDVNVERKEAEDWREIGEGFLYVPKIEDIGYHLKFLCKAISPTKEAHKWHSVTTPTPVSAGPGTTPFDVRQLYTSKAIIDPSCMRVLSYNILADCYLEDEATRLAWFGYCPQYALKIDYRQQLLLKEILGYNSDILCLQECGRRLFQNFLIPVLQSQGYSGVALYKSGVMAEGEAIFFRESKFSLVSQHDIVIKDSFLNDPINQELLNNTQEFPQVLEKMLSRTTVAQVLVLKSTDSPHHYICIVNTHLYFRPNAACIRNLQIITILNHMNKVLKELEMKLKESGNGNFNIGVLFCGDLNSLPNTAVKDLLCGHVVQPDHQDWILKQGNDKEDVQLKMPTFRNPFDFQECSGSPEFTTYTEGFKGAIDYIFASKDKFEVQANLPMPTAEELEVYTAIPSPVLSSDHLAIVCELKWKD